VTAAIVATDSHGLVRAYNAAAEALYGPASSDVLGRRTSEIVDLLDLDGRPIRIRKLLQASPGASWSGRIVARPLVGPLAGRHMLVDVSFAPIDAAAGPAAGVISSSTAVQPATHEGIGGLDAVVEATAHERTTTAIATAASARLMESTGSEIVLVVTWDGDGGRVEAAAGVDAASISAMEAAPMAGLRRALTGARGLLALEDLSVMFPGSGARHEAVHGPVTGVLVELRAGDESIGFLGMGSQRPAWPRPSDRDLQAVAAQLAAAIEAVRLRDRLERGLMEERRLVGQLERLVGLTLLPTGEVDEATTAGLLLDRVVAALGADGGLVVREAGEHLQVLADVGLDAGMRRAIESIPPEILPMWSQFLGRNDDRAYYQRLADMTTHHPGLPGMIDVGIIAYAAFPLREDGRLYGAFVCYFMSEALAAQVDERNLEAVGRIIAIAYANAHMSAGLARAMRSERRLSATLRTLQDLTLLGASTDDLGRLARETVDSVVAATGAAGGGYMLVDPNAERIDPFIWIGSPSSRWPEFGEASVAPDDWPSISHLRGREEVWTSGTALPGGGGAQAVLPLRVDGRLAGLLHLEWTDTAGETPVDERVLEPIARICSISLATFRLRAELMSRAAAQRSLGHRVAALEDLTRIGEQAGSFEELAQKTVTSVRDALNSDAVWYLLAETGGRFEIHATTGELGAFRRLLAGVHAVDVPGGNSLLDGEGSEIGEFFDGRVSERTRELAAESGFRSYASIPIRIGQELAGALICLFRQPPALDDGALDSVSRIAGIALANYRLRERLVSSEERYRTLFEESPEALMVTSLGGIVLDVNEAAVSLFHADRSEMIDHYIGDFLSTDERELARRRQLVWSEGRGTFRDRARRADGSEFAIENESRVVELDRQRRFLILLRDLSDQEQLQRELLQAQKMEAIGQLVAGVAHELNNPLAAIVAIGQLLNTDPRLPDDMKHDAGLLVQETNRTRRIVQGLLDFARARPPERWPTSISALVKSVLELQAYALSAKQVEVELDIPDTLPLVDLDRAQLQQVLLNLTINAIHELRISTGGPVPRLRVGAELVRPPLRKGVRIDRGRDDTRVRITVTDNGPGVPEAVRPRLFLPFFTTKQPGEGTGLGLSVSFGIVAAHDGQLWYEPGPGGIGSSFVIEMPVRARVNEDVEAAEPTPWEQRVYSPPSPAASGDQPDRAGAAEVEVTVEEGEERPRVLALDDEPAIRQVMIKALAQVGIECVAFADGPSALQAIRQAEFAMMLVDHRMAGMSGTEFYLAAVAMKPELASRTVFMSGDVMNPDLADFAKARSIRLLAKPFDIPAVIRVVRETMAGGHGHGGRAH
jgi:two-component system, NtrC family, sensor kinase